MIESGEDSDHDELSLTIKLANPEPCHQFDPPPEVLKSSKLATVQPCTQDFSKEGSYSRASGFCLSQCS